MKNSTARKMVFDKAPYDNVIMFPGTEYMLETDHEIDNDFNADHDADSGVIGILFDDILMSKLSDVLSPIVCTACFVYIMYQVFNWLMYV